MAHRRLSVYLGLLSLVLCLTTWALDLNQFVTQCIFCRNERTVIGILGIMLLLSAKSHLIRYPSLVFGFYGASTSAQHIMLIMNHGHFSSPQLPLTILALFIIIGQVYFIFNLPVKKNTVEG